MDDPLFITFGAYLLKFATHHFRGRHFRDHGRRGGTEDPRRLLRDLVGDLTEPGGRRVEVPGVDVPGRRRAWDVFAYDVV